MFDASSLLRTFDSKTIKSVEKLKCILFKHDSILLLCKELGRTPQINGGFRNFKICARAPLKGYHTGVIISDNDTTMHVHLKHKKINHKKDKGKKQVSH